MKQILNLTIIAGLLIGMLACEKDDPVIPNEEELITTLEYTLVSSTGGTVVFSFQDLDGEGGNSPVVTSGTLSKNTEYTGSLKLYNETETPKEDITVEIKEEDEEHQFFFQPDSDLDLSVSYSDTDGDGKPVGLATTVQTGDASSGTLTITLRHEPNKSASGVSTGDITNAGGETDIEVHFIVNIE